MDTPLNPVVLDELPPTSPPNTEIESNAGDLINEELMDACEQLHVDNHVTDNIMENTTKWRYTHRTNQELRIQYEELKAEMKRNTVVELHCARNLKRLVNKSRASSRIKSMVYKTIFKQDTNTDEQNAKLARKILKKITIAESAGRTSPAAEHM
ncbi:hypothetical protein BCR43DRAFT_509216 [Syncephalastrum racemosum]|uniref:Uncharacterized protein n=1 Tax=Syncephalastrum racemosum TaxID=13706 RepID=A0A1X2H002_SYNRA|nr:hypothetical protein BCR43DRAFT_509216 [Syncephalastrum racemosum]